MNSGYHHSPQDPGLPSLLPYQPGHTKSPLSLFSEAKEGPGQLLWRRKWQDCALPSDARQPVLPSPVSAPASGPPTDLSPWQP